MTGEMYQALRRHTILARLMPDTDAGLEDEAVQRSFVAGLIDQPGRRGAPDAVAVLDPRAGPV